MAVLTRKEARIDRLRCLIATSRGCVAANDGCEKCERAIEAATEKLRALGVAV